jgi:hypothetical protein
MGDLTMEKQMIYEKEIQPFIQKIGAICKYHGWEFSAVVAFDVGEYRRVHYGEDKEFIPRSTTLSENARIHGMNLLSQTIDS